MSMSASAVLSTGRVLSADPRRVFTAFAQPEQLARWWGPDGFTNTFATFEFRPGGRWVFVMHGPNGMDHPNECCFREIEKNARIVIEHVGKPWFILTVALTPRGQHTHLVWDQEFDNPATVDSLRAMCEPANEQNLDRLQAVLAGGMSAQRLCQEPNLRQVPRSLSEIDSVGWLGLVWHLRRCRNGQIALLSSPFLRLGSAKRSTAPSSVVYLRQTPRLPGSLASRRLGKPSKRSWP